MLNKQLLNVKDLYVDVEDKKSFTAWICPLVKGRRMFDGTERYR